jgi:curved DNA-binding protein CbpA
MPDYYEVLQVHPRAESEVIRAAYRILARKYHPDHGGDPLRMIALNDAWDVLGDPAQRAAYDAARDRAAKASVAAATPSSAGSARPIGTTPPGTGGPRPEAQPPGAPRPETARPTSSGATTEVVHAGPPPGRPSGTVLDFGRYSGWSLGEIARHDLDYLEWLQRATFGRRLRAEIDVLLAGRRGSPSATHEPIGRGWPRRR